MNNQIEIQSDVKITFSPFGTQNKWFIGTNTENLKMIIAQGLITSPDGFTKYYQDALELFPGWVPVFKNRVPSEIIEKSISETEGLTPCIIELSLENIQGNIRAFKADLIDGKVLFESEINEIDESKIEAVFIPAPIPTSRIKTVYFPNDESKTAFEQETQIYKNVPLIDLKFKVNSKYYMNNPVIGYFHELDLPNLSDNNYSRTYAYGGMLATLFYFAKNGTLTNSTYHSILKQEKLPEHLDEAISLVYSYFQNKELPEASLLARIYYGLLNVIISSSGCVEDNIVEFLTNFDDGQVKRAQEIVATLLNISSLNDKTVSDYLHDAGSPLEKFLIMLFMREEVVDLMEFHLDMLNESDYLLFAIIFGIRDQFVNLPKFLREFRSLQNTITTIMANYHHQFSDTNMSFDMMQSEPPTMVDMFEKATFKQWYAKSNKIECLKTTIKIPKGEYLLNVLGSGIEIVFDGTPKNTNIEVKDEIFYNFLINSKVTDYNKLFAQYKRMK